MNTLLLMAGTDAPAYRERFEHTMPALRVIDRVASDDRANVDFVAGWKAPPGLFATLPNLRAVFALGAGVDAMLGRTDLPADVPLVRLLDAGMAEQMVEYALLGVLTWQRRMHDYRVQQTRSLWHPQPPRMRAEVRVGVLGLGSLGGIVATALAELGYNVRGWSRTPRTLAGVHCTHGDTGLPELLADTDVLINMLPSTVQTRGLLDHQRLGMLRPGAYVVNAARGDQLDHVALLALLDKGTLGGALLDVFPHEPLPTDSRLWSHPRVQITPHVAACTLVEPAARQIVDNINRLQTGLPMFGVVDRGRSY